MNHQDRVIMFVDMVGSTELKYREEAVAPVLVQKLYKMVHKIVRRSSLFVKFTGDGAMVVFRGGRAGCRAALQAARDIVVGVDEYNLGFWHESGKFPGSFIRLEVRVGIATGPCTLIEKGSEDVVGRPADLAARLCQAAETDQILVPKTVVDLSGLPPEEFRQEERRLVLRGIPLPEDAGGESFHLLQVPRLVSQLLPKTFPSGMLRAYTKREELNHEFDIVSLLERAAPGSEVLVVGRTLVAWATMPEAAKDTIRKKRLTLNLLVSSKAACRALHDEEVAVITRDKRAALPLFRKLTATPGINARFHETGVLIADGFTCASVMVGKTKKDIVLRDISSGARTHKVTVLFACTCDRHSSRRGQCIACGMKERGTKLLAKARNVTKP
jgi:class 3 adenylate cyclase